MNVADLVYLRCLWLHYFVKGPQERAEEFVHQMVKLLEQSVYNALPKTRSTVSGDIWGLATCGSQ